MCGLQAIFPASKIQQPKFIGIGRGKLRIMQIHAPYPIALTFEIADQVVTDKSSSARNQHLTTVSHRTPLKQGVAFLNVLDYCK
jgi:hypothetical protein